MSVLLGCQAVAKTTSQGELFRNLSLGISAGDRLGVIGPNGSGKSTLLRLFLREDQVDHGSISRRKEIRVAYVPQRATYDAERTLLEIVENAAISSAVPSDEYHARANVALGKSGFEDVNAKVKTLSGGWVQRLTLACAFVQDAEIVLFDEPTNHLDLQGILWLEKTLATAVFSWVLVSHDRYFLANTVNKVLEIDRIYPDGHFIVEGSYRQFLQKKEEFLAAQERYKDAVSNKVRRETEWLSRGPKARTSKAKYRIDEAHRLISELKEVEGRMQTSEVGIDFSSSGRKTKKLVKVKGIYKSFGERQIVSDLSFMLSPGSAVGVLGANGTGKTTALKLIMGELEPDQGSVVHATDLTMVCFDQNREQLDPTCSLKGALAETGDAVVYRGKSIHVIAWAKRFQFQPNQLPLPVGKLSGGEQARLLISRLMLKPADLLLLDEPTNDLDISTLEVLEESLLDFPGAVILVTHDRFMLNRVCNGFIGLDGEGNSKLYADYDQWESDVLRAPSIKGRKGGKSGKERKGSEKKPGKRLSYLEQREYEMIEEEILAAEDEVKACQCAAEDPVIITDSVRLADAYSALHEAQEKVERLYTRWEELENKR